MTWFELIKQVVRVPEAAAYYGLQVNRNGMARCPFHDDRHPSMKLNGAGRLPLVAVELLAT